MSQTGSRPNDAGRLRTAIWRRLLGCGEGTILSRLWFCLAAQPGRPSRLVNAFAERSTVFIWSYHPFRACQIPLDGGLCRPDMGYNTHREPQWDGAGLGATSDAPTAPDATARAALVPQNSPVGRQKRGENRPKSGSHERPAKANFLTFLNTVIGRDSLSSYLDE